VTTPRAPIASRSRRRRRRLPGVGRWLVRIAIVVIVFAIGVAVGQALEDRPPSREPVTNISTIRPWTQTQP
jgi:hypothetical protein